jgi:hypothetical protein
VQPPGWRGPLDQRLIGRLKPSRLAGDRLHHPARVTWIPNRASAFAVFCGESPSSLFSSVASATARGPSMQAAAPSASEV